MFRKFAYVIFCLVALALAFSCVRVSPDVAPDSGKTENTDKGKEQGGEAPDDTDPGSTVVDEDGNVIRNPENPDTPGGEGIPGGGGSGAGGRGLSFVCSLADVAGTKVSIQGVNSEKKSLLSWEAGDRITIRYKGKNYLYYAIVAGRENIPFEPVSAQEGEFLDGGLDGNEPIFYFYNMSDCGDNSAKFTVSASQTAGELSNKMPLYGYNASSTEKLVDGTLYFTMKPAAQVLQLRVTYASKATDVRRVELESFHTSGYLCGTGSFTVNPITGAVTPPSGEGGSRLTLNYTSNRNFSAGNPDAGDDIYLIVGPATIRSVRLTMYNSSSTLRFWHSFYLENDVSLAGRHIFTKIRNAIVNGPDLFYACEHSVADPVWSIFNEGTADGGNGAVNIRSDIDAVTAEHEELYMTSRGMNADIVWSVPGGSVSEDKALLVNEVSGNVINWHMWKEQENGADGSVPCYRFEGGTLDGNNHKITIHSNHSWSHAALLRFVRNSTVSNLRIGGEIRLTYNGTKRNVYAAGLAVQGYGSFTACGNEADITYINAGKIPNTSVCLGGVISYLSGDSSFKGCFNAGMLTAESTSALRLGGIAGWFTSSEKGNLTLDDCSNSGNLSLTGTENTNPYIYAGGIIGVSAQGGSTGSTTIIRGCSNTGNIECDMVNFDKDYFVGGIMGRCGGGHVTDLVIEGCTNGSAANPGNCGNIKVNGLGYVCAGGIVGNVNMLTTSETEVVPVPYTDDVLRIKLGASGSPNVNYGTITDNIGTTTASSGIKFEDTVLGSSFIGGIAGRVQSTSRISHCENRGKVTSSFSGSWGQVKKSETGTYSFPLKYLGGLFGTLNGGNQVEHTVSDCINAGTVRTEDDCVAMVRLGGIVASAYSTKKVSFDNCENSGTVYSKKASFHLGRDLGLVLESDNPFSSHLGGIAGTVTAFTSEFVSCRNSGTVMAGNDDANSASAIQSIGGIAGLARASGLKSEYPSDASFTFTGCSNEGEVSYRTKRSGDNYFTNNGAVGGIVGSAINSIVDDTAVEDNINCVYSIQNCSNSGSVTSNARLLWGTGGILGYISPSFSLSIGTESACSNTGAVTVMSSDCDGTGGILGNSGGSAAATLYRNKTIKNCSCSDCTISSGSSYTGGVAGICYYVHLEGCRVNNVEIVSEYSYLGGIVGCHTRDSIVDCDVTSSSVTSRSGNELGGVAGYVYGTDLSDCDVDRVTVESLLKTDASDDAGGIVGQVRRFKIADNSYDDTTISNCTFYRGSVSINDNNAGGIAGFMSYGTISDCRSYYNQISCRARAGGIVGRLDSGNVVRCYFNGGDGTDNKPKSNVKATANEAGGIVGGTAGSITAESDDQIWIDNCFVQNTPNITGAYQVGGIMGYYNVSSITDAELVIINCLFASGILTSTGYDSNTNSNMVGGIIGAAFAGEARNGGFVKIYNCGAYYNNSADRIVAVASTNWRIGGIAGSLSTHSAVSTPDKQTYIWLNNNLTDLLVKNIKVNGSNPTDTDLGNKHIGLYVGMFNSTNRLLNSSGGLQCTGRRFLRPNNNQAFKVFGYENNVAFVPGLLGNLSKSYSDIHSVQNTDDEIMKIINYQVHDDSDGTDKTNYCKWNVAQTKPYMGTEKFKPGEYL